MKNITLILFPLLLFGCSTIKGVKVDQEGKSCLDRQDIERLIEHQSEKGELPSHLFIEPIVVKDNNCVGLLGFNFKNPTVTGRIVQKVLKFEEELYIFSVNNESANQRALSRFESKYGSIFSDNELEQLRQVFNKGTEINARLH